MTEIKQFLTNLFDKYFIYKRHQFLALLIYILESISNRTIEYENDYQYCIGFFSMLFGSIVYDSVPTNILMTLIENERDTSIQLDANLASLQPSENFGLMIDTLTNLMFQSSTQSIQDFTNLDGFTITQTDSIVTLNGIQASTVRGCIWKLMYSNLVYKLTPPVG